MKYYNTCPECGATLDPGEKCDCKKSTPSTEQTSVQEIDKQSTYNIAQNDRNVKQI